MMRVLDRVIEGRVYSAIERSWPDQDAAAYLRGLSPREAVHVAVDGSGEVVGYQSLDLYSAILPSMSHVGQIGTFITPEVRGCGVGRALFAATEAFAREHGYAKFVIQVRAMNSGAQAFYARMGFRECGRLSRQVLVHGVVDDEVLMEYFL